MKKFVLTVTEDGGFCNVETEANGFTAYEIIGILYSKIHDIYKQWEVPAEFTRKRIHEDGTVEMIEEVLD